MREILFRAKRVNNGEWVEGFYTQLPKPSLGATIVAGGELCAEDVADYIIVNKSKQHSNFSNAYPLEVVECEQYEVIPETVCQCTGSKDKNGKKIFENDIVKCNYDDYGEKRIYIGKVIFREDTCAFVVTDRKSTDYEWWNEEKEVIGNVFDNPELLGGDTD